MWSEIQERNYFQTENNHLKQGIDLFEIYSFPLNTKT